MVTTSSSLRCSQASEDAIGTMRTIAELTCGAGENAPGGPTKIMSNHVLIKGLTVMGVRAGETLQRQPHMGYSYEELPKLAALGVMRPNISHRFSMDRVADAFRVLLDRQVVGKAVIEM